MPQIYAHINPIMVKMFMEVLTERSMGMDINLNRRTE